MTVADLGAPVAYPALPDGVPVYDPDGNRVGTVEHVLADEDADIFHGLLIHAPSAPDSHLFADREQIAGLYEGGVVLSVSPTDLHEPGADTIAADATDESAADHVREGLRRAWEWLSQPR